MKFRDSRTDKIFLSRSENDERRPAVVHGGSVDPCLKLLVLSALASAVKLPILSKDKSSEFLRRSIRANSFHRLEELTNGLAIRYGDLERECIEEVCDHEGHESCDMIKIRCRRTGTSPVCSVRAIIIDYDFIHLKRHTKFSSHLLIGVSL